MGKQKEVPIMSKLAADTVWLIFMGVIDITIIYRFVTEIACQLAGKSTREDGVDRFASVLMAIGVVIIVMMLALLH